MKNDLRTAFLVLLFSVTFFSCENQDISLDGTLSGKISNYNLDVFNTLRFINVTDGGDKAYGGDKEEVGRCTINSNGEFKITLRNPSYLENVQECFNDGNYDISDINNRIAYFEILAYKDKDNDNVGSIDIYNGDATESDIINYNKVVELFYSEKKCKIKGSSNDGISIDITLKTGWNKLVYTDKSIYTDNLSETIWLFRD